MDDNILLNIFLKRNNKLVKCKIQLPYIVARKLMVFAVLITDISFNKDKYKIASGYAKKVLNDIYDEYLEDEECEKILNSYRGTGFMSGEICKKFDITASLFVNHCVSLCHIDSNGLLLKNKYCPKLEQALKAMYDNNGLLNEIYQYKLQDKEEIKIGKINLTTMKPEKI